jgi:hypothetical protein
VNLLAADDVDELQVGILVARSIGPSANMVDVEVLSVRRVYSTLRADPVLASG